MIDVLRQTVLPLLDAVKKSGSGFEARCPAPDHKDRNASLSIEAGHTHPVVFHCHAGCSPEAICSGIGLDWATLCKPREDDQRGNDDWKPAGTVATYEYRDENGALLFEVIRTADKKFLQRRPDPTAKNGWSYKLGDTRRVLYRLQKVITAVAEGRVVWIVEGEKDVHTLEAQGMVATCNAGGAGKWKPEYSEVLRDAVVWIVADNDKPGQAHARAIRESLEGIAADITVAEATSGKDVTDHLQAGHGLEDLDITWPTQEAPKTTLAPDIWDFLAAEDEPYDWLIPGLLERGDRLILTGFEGLGKALDIDTPIPTPSGWTTMGELAIGDEAFGPDGAPTRIVAATDTMTDRPCYRVTFSDGAQIVADANHLWVTETLPAREAASRQARRAETQSRGTDQRHKRVHHPAVITTEGIAATLHARGGHALNHSIETTAPLQYPERDLPIDPYLLGAWLGDGTSAHAEITCDDPEIIDRIRSTGQPVAKMATPYGYRLTCGTRNNRSPHSAQAKLRKLGVLGNKHIPSTYLTASVKQRLALVQGLMDTDGTVGVQSAGTAVCEFSVCNRRLADDMLDLLHGLGIKVTMRSGPAKLNGRTVGTRWRLAFQTDLPVFHLTRKAERQVPQRTRRSKLRYITAVEPVESVPVRCIQVDRADGMFVAGRECIPTHNSMLVRQLAFCAAAGVHPFNPSYSTNFSPVKVLYIDLENSEKQGRRKFRPMGDVIKGLGSPSPFGYLRVLHQPGGIDLTTPDDVAWLFERVTAHTPDVLVVGPFYKLHEANANDEQVARRVVAVLDKARSISNAALITEAHAGHGETGKARSSRPTGSSLLLRWPEFGFGLVPNANAEPDERGRCRHVDVQSWRGSRDERDWPTHLQYGNPASQLPWVPWKPETTPKGK